MCAIRERNLGLTLLHSACPDPERGTQGPDPSLKNHKAIGFLKNTGPDPNPAFNVGPSSAHQRNTI